MHLVRQIGASSQAWDPIIPGLRQSGEFHDGGKRLQTQAESHQLAGWFPGGVSSLLLLLLLATQTPPQSPAVEGGKSPYFHENDEKFLHLVWKEKQFGVVESFEEFLPAVRWNYGVPEEPAGTGLSFCDNYIKQLPPNSRRYVKAKQLTVPGWSARNIPSDAPRVPGRFSPDTDDTTGPLEPPRAPRGGREGGGHPFNVSSRPT